MQQNSFTISDKFLNSSKNYNAEMKDDLVFISIYYVKKSYELIKQIPKMQPFDLVSSVGGTLSLFIGISFLTLVEIIEILFEISIIFINKMKNKRNVSLALPQQKIAIEAKSQVAINA